MNEARQILETIINDFSDGGFSRFFREKSRQFVAREENYSRYNDDDFKNGLRLGEINFSDGDSLIICAFEVKKALSERAGKKAQYDKAKNILKSAENQKFSAGIFVFYDSGGNFRFSLVYPESIGVRRQWSNFRRFTYFVSREFTNKTFLQRIGGGDFSSLDKVKDAFSVEKVTKEFYQDIANWYFWAVQNSKFPQDTKREKNDRNIAIIRLITRLIFIWFMRERGLMPKELFDEKTIRERLKDLSSEQSTYYQAILQNLFFATLSTPKNERQFAIETRGYRGRNEDFGNDLRFRYHECFKSQDKLKEYFNDIPFLNGGLFECLDDRKAGIIIDGFSRTKKNQPEVPNKLFFSKECNVDLNVDFGTKNKKYKVQGILNTLSSYNFTIDENSPDDADVALDPKLLGRVFENLLASFNPETSTTARKATGSYYTPREIVDYMVTESFKAYFKTHLLAISDLDNKIDQLFSTGSEENPFNKSESKKLVELIESVKIVDPAVGSGAFPMGALNKLVFILNKVDPGNELWKQAQISAADTIPDPRIKQDAKNRIEEFFKDKNADYGRKLYLIQKCIYGVDIQQIAVEIAKLRFFISLLVDEGIDKTKKNWGIEPLPNLDFKIMQGNSLISEFLGIDFDKGQEKREVYYGQFEFGSENKEECLIKEFEQKKIDYQNESDKNKKAKLKIEIEDLMIKLFEVKLQKKYSELKPIEERAQNIPNLKARKEYVKTEKEKFSKKHGFDLKNIEKQLREFSSKRKLRSFFPWKLYFAEVFENGGFDIVIGNPPYAVYNINERLKQIYREIFESINYKYNGIKNQFNLATLFIEKSVLILKQEGTLSLIVPHSISRVSGYLYTREYLNKFTDVFHIVDECGQFENVTLEMVTIFAKRTNEKRKNSIIVLSRRNNKKYFIPKTVYDEEKYYVLYADEIFYKMKECGEKLLNGYRGFEISKLENESKKDNLMYLEGKNISKYRINILANQGYVNEKYTKDMKLDKYEIVITQFGTLPRGAIIDTTKMIPSGGNVIITYNKNLYDIKYILALLNSKLTEYYFFNYVINQANLTIHLDGDYINKIRILDVGRTEQKPFIEIVDKILAITKDDLPAPQASRQAGDYLQNPAKQEQVKKYEREIDEMVYKLYGLSEAEVKIVEVKFIDENACTML